MIVQLLSNTPHAVALYCKAGTPIMLLQDGVYSAAAIHSRFPQQACYALDTDWFAAGLAKMTYVELVTTAQWVNLCALHQPVVTVQQ